MDQPPPDSPPPRPHWIRIAGLVLTIGYFALAAVTLIWGAYKRFHIPQAPVVDPDVRGYLGPALVALTGKKFVHMGGRSFPYPAFVLMLLRCCGDFRALTVVQHVFGVAAGAITMLAWNAMLRLVPEGGIPRLVAWFIGIAPAAIYLGSATAIRFEMQIRPEAIFPVFAILDLYLGFLFIEARFIKRGPAAVWIGALNVFVAGLLYLLRPSFGLASGFATAPVWISLLIGGMPARQRGVLALAAIVPAALLLFLPEHVLKRNDTWSREFVPETLFTIHASLILDQLTHDLATNVPVPYPRAFLQTCHDLLATDIQKAASTTTLKPFPTLGYDPQYLMYNSFCGEFQKVTGWDPVALDKFYLYYYKRVVTQQPWAVWRKIITQMRIFYCSKNPAYRLGQTMDLSDDYSQTPGMVSKDIPYGMAYPPLQSWFQQCNALAAAGASVDQPRRLTEWTRFLAGHYMDLLMVALVSPLILLACPLRRHLAGLVAALWLAYSYNFGNCLTIAIVHSLELFRYTRIQLLYTVFAQCLAIYFMAEAVTYSVRSIIERRTK